MLVLSRRSVKLLLYSMFLPRPFPSDACRTRCTDSPALGFASLSILRRAGLHTHTSIYTYESKNLGKTVLAYERTITRSERFDLRAFPVQFTLILLLIFRPIDGMMGVLELHELNSPFDTQQSYHRVVFRLNSFTLVIGVLD